jgi:hypothetical protein
MIQISVCENKTRKTKQTKAGNCGNIKIAYNEQKSRITKKAQNPLYSPSGIYIRQIAETIEEINGAKN